MLFDWDSANLNHIARHKVTREEVEQVIGNDPLDVGVVIRNREPRTIHLGETDSGRVLFIVVTGRNDMYRVVTARPAKRKERTFYAKHKATLREENT